MQSASIYLSAAVVADDGDDKNSSHRCQDLHTLQPLCVGALLYIVFPKTMLSGRDWKCSCWGIQGLKRVSVCGGSHRS